MKQHQQPPILQRRYADGPLPFSMEIYKDLQKLKEFCSPANALFYDQLPHGTEIKSGVNSAPLRGEASSKCAHTVSDSDELIEQYS